MYDSLACFEKYLPIRDQRHIDQFHNAWRYHQPIVRISSGKTCAEIARILEKNSIKPKQNKKNWTSPSRYEVLRNANFRCMACGAPASKGELHIDHIKPISKYPHLKHDVDNLQVLCCACNTSKSNKYEDDLRPDTPKSKRAKRSAACQKETDQIEMF